MQIIIDQSASPAQSDALAKIMTGADTDDMATMWWVFSAMSPNKLETLYLPINLTMDLKARTGHTKVPDVFESHAQPLTNPVTGAEHRAGIDLPHGFEFRVAELAKATTRTQGAISLDHNQESYAHLVEIRLSNTGVVAAA